MDFLQSVLSIGIDWVYWKVFICYDIKFVLVSHFYLLNFATQVIISNFFSIKIEQTNLCLNCNFVLLSKHWVIFSWICIFWKCYSYYPIEWIQFDYIEVIGPNDLSFFDFLLFVLDEWTPSEYMLLDLVIFCFLEKNKPYCIVVAYNSWLDINFILEF